MTPLRGQKVQEMLSRKGRESSREADRVGVRQSCTYRAGGEGRGRMWGEDRPHGIRDPSSAGL